MNIELIKQEIEKLSALLSSWSEGKEVSAIERDLALDKLTKLYELVRFGTTIPEATIAPSAVEQNAPEEVDEAEEKEVEVEFIFAEDDEDAEETITEEAEGEVTEEEATEEVDNTEEAEEELSATAIIAAATAQAISTEEAAEAAEVTEPEVMVEPAEVETEVEPEVEIEPEPEAIVEPEPIPQPAPAEPEPVAEPEKPMERPQRRPKMESLFGADEIQRKPRSKHQRMMAIYGETQQKQEKVVDISKIFDMDDDEGFEISVSSNTRAAEPITHNTVNDLSSGETTILADAIAPAKTTLADTIAAPAALAEEITHSHIKSLRQAIGINDKFLMTRDLFDGDDRAFDQAIMELDECESFDDCMIHIAENYEWNPDSEGAKFMMQLLERKHS